MNGEFDLLFTRFKGRIQDAEKSHAAGTCVFNLQDYLVCEEFSLKIDEQEAETIAVKLNFRDSNEVLLTNLQDEEEDKEQLQIEMKIETCAFLNFFILKPDVQFIKQIKTKKDGSIEYRYYVAAKLIAIDDDNQNSNGTGYVKTITQFYDVQTPNKIRHLIEPQRRYEVKFLLDQSFIKAFNEQDQLWQIMPIVLKGDNSVLGTVIFEKYGTDEIVLSFFQSQFSKLAKKSDDLDQEEEDLQFPQNPVPQTWIVDYPLLAYKTFTPNNKEIAIVHLA